MVPKLIFSSESWDPKHREDVDRLFAKHFTLNNNEDIWYWKRNSNVHMFAYKGYENCKAVLLDYVYADTEAAIDKYVQKYVNDLDNEYYIEVGLLSIDNEKYYKSGPYVNAEGKDTGFDYWDFYDSADDVTRDYEGYWVSITVYLIQK